MLVRLAAADTAALVFRAAVPAAAKHCDINDY